MAKEVSWEDAASAAPAPAAISAPKPSKEVAWEDVSAAPEKPKPHSMLAEAGAAFADVPREIGHQFMEEGRAAAKDIKANKGPKSLLDIGPTGQEVSAFGHVLGQAASPLTGALTSVLGRPIETATGGKVKRETVGNAASMAMPFVQELKAAQEGTALAKAMGVSAKTAREATTAGEKIRKVSALGEDPYQSAVDMLRREGVRVTPGRQRGRYAKRVEEAWKSSTHVGHGIREAERDSLIDMNRAFYNRALKSIGETASKDKLPDSKVGNEGIAYVEKRLSDAYDRLKPHVKFQRDDAFIKGVDDIRKEAESLPSAQQEHLGRLLMQHIEPALASGSMNGDEFKRVDSVIGTHARALKQEGGYSAMAGRMLEDVQGLMRENIERHSDPKIAKQLRDTNSGWAQYVRLRTAAANRAKSDGLFTPGDVLGAIKREDKSVGKGAFARGEALMQDLARAGNRVLSDVVPDSGTAERYGATHRGVGGLVVGATLGHLPGALVGGALDFLSAPLTNRLSHKVMSDLGKFEPKNPRLAAGAPSPARKRNPLPVAGALAKALAKPDTDVPQN